MSTSTLPSQTSNKPVGLWEVALTFALISSTSFGGGQKASIRHQVVQKGWMTNDEFIEGLELAQVMPGPNILNLAIFCGQRVRGTIGAVVAAAAASIPPFAIVMIAGALYFTFISNPWVKAGLAGCAAGAVGLTLGNAFELSIDYRRDWIRVALIALTAIAVSKFRVPLVVVLVFFGGIGIWREHAAPLKAS